VGLRAGQSSLEVIRVFLLLRVAPVAAGSRSAVQHATADDDARATAIHAALAEAIAARDYRTYHRESRLFHMALLAPSRMHRLLHMVESAWNVTEPAQPMSTVPDDERTRMHEDHAAMLAAFVARDADELARCSREHYQRLEGAVDT
jgi:DNA-binding GntR family transcriptional regulator